MSPSNLQIKRSWQGSSALGNSSGVADFVLARFTPDGQLDTEFDGDGFVVTDFPDSQLERVEAVLVQPDGKIVAGGAGRSYRSRPRGSDRLRARAV